MLSIEVCSVVQHTRILVRRIIVLCAVYHLIPTTVRREYLCRVFVLSVLVMKFKNSLKDYKLPSNEETANHVEIYVNSTNQKYLIETKHVLI